LVFYKTEFSAFWELQHECLELAALDAGHLGEIMLDAHGHPGALVHILLALLLPTLLKIKGQFLSFLYLLNYL
jgi:hypothetical protein